MKDFNILCVEFAVTFLSWRKRLDISVKQPLKYELDLTENKI